MKKFLITIILLIPHISYSQTVTNDSLTMTQKDSLLSKKNEIKVSININDLNSLKSENDELRTSLFNVNKKYELLKTSDSIHAKKLDSLEIKTKLLVNKCSNLETTQNELNKKLVNITANFLYIPFEAYSINEIAIPAFSAITEKSLRDEHFFKFYLLKNYQLHLQELLKFITYSENELSKPFTKNAKEVMDMFHANKVFIDYNKYQDWENTYLGKIMVEMESQFSAFNGRDIKINFENIKSKIEQCLKSL